MPSANDMDNRIKRSHRGTTASMDMVLEAGWKTGRGVAHTIESPVPRHIDRLGGEIVVIGKLSQKADIVTPSSAGYVRPLRIGKKKRWIYKYRLE
jgi:hypothetical protein